MYRKIAVVAVVSALAGCAYQPSKHTPLVMSPSANFDRDLQECRRIGDEAGKRYWDEAVGVEVGSAIGGMVVGAALGSTINSDYALAGAAAGGVAGSASAGSPTTQAVAKTSRVIDRCMINKGHKVISDLGSN